MNERFSAAVVSSISSILQISVKLATNDIVNLVEDRCSYEHVLNLLIIS